MCGFNEGGGFGIGAQDREEGGAGAGHKGGAGFTAVEEPVFELGEVAVFCEDGFLKVVDE